MELKQYLTIFKKHWLFILAFALSGATVAYLFTARLPSGYQQDQLFFISSSQTESEGYTFEGYYAQEKARNFTDTAVAILTSSDFLKEVSKSHEQITARKIAPQLIRITATSDTPENAQNLMEKMAANFNQKLEVLENPNHQVRIKAVSPARAATFTTANKKILIPFGAAVGAIFAIFITGLKTYFRL